MRCCRGDRETESSQFVRAGVCGAPRLSGVPSLRLSLLLGLIAEAVYYLWLDRAGLCRAERSGGSGQKAAAQVVPPLLLLLLSLNFCACRWRRAHRDTFQVLPAKVCRHKLAGSLTRAHEHAARSSKELPQGDPAENRK